MTGRSRRIVAGIPVGVALLVLGCVHARRSAPLDPTRITARIVGAGSLVTRHEGDVAAPRTLKGSVGEVPSEWMPEFTSTADDVHAALGTSIGIEVVVDGAPYLTEVPVRTRVTHPEIVDPQGHAGTADEFSSPMNAGYPRFAGWRFEDPWELVPGTWRIEILLGDRVLAAQEFQVTVAP